MRLNPSCIRDILLAVETYSDFDTQAEYKIEEPFPELSSYTHSEILYHIRQCEESGLIQEVHYYDGGKHTDISDLTPAGHEFLANIRNDSIWKKVISKGSGASLSILMELAKQAALKYFLS